MSYNNQKRKQDPGDYIKQFLKSCNHEISILKRQIHKSQLFKKWDQSFSHSRRRLLKRGLITCVVSAPLVDVFLYEPRHIQLNTYYVPVPNLPSSLKGMRIVQLSDMHRGPITSDSIISKAIEIANSTQPDIAVMTGDFVTGEAKNAVPLAEMLINLRPKSGLYGVLGNHDHTAGAEVVSQVLEASGVRMLINKSVPLADGIFLVGLDDYAYGKPDVKAAFEGISKDDFHITLVHNPVAAGSIKHRNGLLISGHTHGSQVRIPFVPIHTLPGLVAGKYWSGWYLDDELRTYVNRGIGMTNLPIRFLCRPEVTLFILEPDPSP